LTSRSLGEYFQSIWNKSVNLSDLSENNNKSYPSRMKRNHPQQ